MKDSLRSHFDEILGRHFERLIGTKQGIGELPLNVATIGCFVLLGGREIEIENSPSEDIERYTHDTFLREAADVGIYPDDYLKTWLQNMIQRGYAEVDSEGRFFTRQSTVIMARLLDRIFPKMPGINFLAYMGQTIEEVVTGRTDMDAAISRFDQTLKHHGVSVSRQKSLHTSPSKGAETSQASANDQQKSQLSREHILAELYSHSKARQEPTTTPPSPSSHKILAGGSILKTVEVDKIFPKEEMSPKIIQNTEVEEKGASGESPNVVQHSPIQDVKAQEVYQEVRAKIVTGGLDIDEVEGSVSLANEKAHQVCHDATEDQVKATPITDGEDQELIDETAEEEGTQDDDIANRIAVFEKDLALTCPICRENVLKEQSTAAGKIYYSCPSNACNFISWGKPHLLECKRCKNSFLVEVTDTSGQIILKCPRATCQHRQGLSPKRVKVVRKRLARRKK